MKMCSICSGECCICANSGFCVAGHGDDEFSYATKEKIIENLDNNRFPDYRDYMIEHLKKTFGYDYKNETKEHNEKLEKNISNTHISDLPLTIVYKIDGVEYVTKGQYLQNIDCYNKRIDQLNKQIEELRTKNAELPSEPIEVAQFLIGLSKEVNDFGLHYFKKIYNIPKLRQIAEHLLVYCNNNEVK